MAKVVYYIYAGSGDPILVRRSGGAAMEWKPYISMCKSTTLVAKDRRVSTLFARIHFPEVFEHGT